MLSDPNTGTVYYVLNALDECDEKSLKKLLHNFQKLFSPEYGQSHRLKLIAVSRDHPSCLRKSLERFPSVLLDPEANGDIQQFIDARVLLLVKERGYPDTLRTHLRNQLQKKAQGNTLWIALVTKALQECGTTEVREELEQFIPELDEFYGRMLLQVKPKHRKFVAEVLLWVIVFKRPLLLSELGTGLGLSSSTAALDNFSFNLIVKEKLSHCRLFPNMEVYRGSYLVRKEVFESN